jgi:hypothetical protein
MKIDDRPTRLSRRRGRNGRRQGYGLAELAIAFVLLTAAMSVTVKALSWVASERTTADRRRWVALELSNAMERIMAEPFDRVTAERAKAIVADTPLSKDLHAAEIDAHVDDESAGALESRRVRLRVRWKGRSGEWDAPVAITAWVSRGRATP